MSNTILHLGLGSFHRAHLAVYLDALRTSSDSLSPWVITAGNIRPGMEDTIEALINQNGTYTLETVAPDGAYTYALITSIKRVIPFEDQIPQVIKVGSDPLTKIISFTVTEAGYYFNSKDELDLQTFPELKSDLQAAKEGKVGQTIYGALTAILRDRKQRASGQVTLLCCDNLRHNGSRSRSGLLQFLTLLGDSALLDWVTRNTTSPNGMVDRITPRPTPVVASRVKSATGRNDPASVMAESFIQWVLQDNFIAGRPQFEQVGVEFVSSVTAHEEAKIRILNASHSCIA